MHLMQPAARLIGRLQHGLTPWRRRAPAVEVTAAAARTLWSERWFPTEAWIARLEAAARRGGAVVMRGGDFDPWDLHFRGGLFGWARTHITTEEHGGGKQLLRLHARTRPPRPALALALGLGLLALFAFSITRGSQRPCSVRSASTLGVLIVRDCAASRLSCAHAVEALKRSIEAEPEVPSRVMRASGHYRRVLALARTDGALSPPFS